MEDTLGENLVNTESFKAVTVLILVLMEDTLGEVKYTDNSNFFVLS